MNSNWTDPLFRAIGLLALVSIIAGCTPAQHKLEPAIIQQAGIPPTRDTTIALLGSTGMAGGYILREALARGYRVRALSRSADKLAFLSDRVETVTGDARDPETIATLLRGSDVVVSAIGPGARGPGDLNSRTSANVIVAMQQSSARPYLVVTGAAVVAEGDERDFTGRWVRRLARLRYPDLASDRQREYDLLAASEVPWTLLRCPLIESTDGAGAMAVSLLTAPGWTVRAGDLASFILDEIETGRYRRQAPFVASD